MLALYPFILFLHFLHLTFHCLSTTKSHKCIFHTKYSNPYFGEKRNQQFCVNLHLTYLDHIGISLIFFLLLLMSNDDWLLRTVVKYESTSDS